MPSPPYASCLMMELRTYKDEPYVELYYKNSTETPPPLYIPKCGYSCPLQDMYQLYADVLPTNNFQTECALPAAAEDRKK